jgi:hypothetical protein
MDSKAVEHRTSFFAAYFAEASKAKKATKAKKASNNRSNVQH